MTPREAALTGARQIGFTVVSISLSLVAVFIPILLMGGLIGRLFREFAVTLSASILVSAVVSLTLTPMLCGHFLRRPSGNARRGSELSKKFQDAYAAVSAGFSDIAFHANADRRHPGCDYLALRFHAKGILSAAGYRSVDRNNRSRARRFLRGDGQKTTTNGQNSAGRSCHCNRRILRRIGRAGPHKTMEGCSLPSSLRISVRRSTRSWPDFAPSSQAARHFALASADSGYSRRRAPAKALYQYALRSVDLEDLIPGHPAWSKS